MVESFTFLIDGKNIRGYFHKPPKHADKLVIFLHGFTGNKTEHSYHFRDFSRVLEKHSIASVRFDFRNNSESDGEFKDFKLLEAFIDAKEIINKFGKAYKEVILLGYSMGGAIASNIKNPLVNKLVLWSPAFNLGENLEKRFLNLFNETNEVVTSGFVYSKEMVDSFVNYCFTSNWNTGLSTLITYGMKDEVVSYDYIKRYNKENNSSHLLVYENSGHGYDDVSEFQKLMDDTLAFILK